MLDVHPAHHAANTWKEFFTHIATIVLGLLIAIGLEQTVEYFHHRHQVADTREALGRERESNIARFSVENDDLERAVPAFQEDLAVFAYLKANAGATADHWPGTLGGQIITTTYLDSAWRGAQQGNVLEHMPQAEVQNNERLYRLLENLNALEATKFEQIYELRKALAVEPDAAKLSGAQLDASIDRTLDLLVTCLKIHNRQTNLNTYFPDFKGYTSTPNLSLRGTLHWPEYDPASEQGKAFAKLGERIKAINAADYEEMGIIEREATR